MSNGANESENTSIVRAPPLFKGGGGWKILALKQMGGLEKHS